MMKAPASTRPVMHQKVDAPSLTEEVNAQLPAVAE